MTCLVGVGTDRFAPWGCDVAASEMNCADTACGGNDAGKGAGG